MSILILSAPIHSGKTTLLEKFIANNNCAGIICPDVEGLRKIFDITTRIFFDFQTKESTSESSISIGKYIFLKSGFDKANQIITNCINDTSDYTIIDEIGHLELSDEGLEPAFSNLLKNRINKNLLLIIRTNLLQDCILKYNLQNAIILDLDAFRTTFDL
jgi:nucleoside-triphosphatase